MQDDFGVFSAEDKANAAYAACIGGWVASGAILGSVAGGQTLLLAAGGLLWGLVTCERISKAVTQKLSGANPQSLTEAELASIVKVLKTDAGVSSTGDALYVLAMARQANLSGDSQQTAPQCTAYQRLERNAQVLLDFRGRLA